MKILVVGLGSMGKRRIRLIRSFFPQHALCGVDARADRRAETADRFGVTCYESVAEAAAAFAPQAGLVCTSPLSHAALICELLARELDIFTEINLVADGYAENIARARALGKTLFLSSTPLYRREMQYVTGAVAGAERPVSYRYHVGQYLPDWHPWETFSEFFVGDARTNGCREIFAIELPWMQRAFGPVTDVQVHAACRTSLGLPYPDSYLVTLTHQNGAAGQFAADVVSRKAVRHLEVYGEDLYLTWNGTPDSLLRYDIETRADAAVPLYESVEQDPRYAQNIIENAYVDELAAFFDTLAGKPAMRHTFEDDEKVLAVIDRIEEGRL